MFMIMGSMWMSIEEYIEKEKYLTLFLCYRVSAYARLLRKYTIITAAMTLTRS